MKRRGYILLEALIALFLIASLSAVLYPFAAEAVRAVDLMAKRRGSRARDSMPWIS